MINICETCRHRYKRKDQEPCKECSGINWEPKEAENEEKKEEKMEKRNCDNCRYEDCPYWAWPCKKCLELPDDYTRYWKPKEEEDEEKKEEKGKEDKDFEWPCFEKLQESVREMGKDIETGMKEIKLEKKPGLLAFPAPIYERTDSEIPEKVRISFTNGTSAIYALKVDQPAPQLIECVRIIRKWNNGYKAPTRRRRRK